MVFRWIQDCFTINSGSRVLNGSDDMIVWKAKSMVPMAIGKKSYFF